MLILRAAWALSKVADVDLWGLPDPGDLPVGSERRIVGVVAAGGLQSGRGPRRHLSSALLQSVWVALKHRITQSE